MGAVAVAAGMSANDYMETVTSFSASLISSLDGDIAAEAENAISGSINSLQAALQNMLVGFCDANADMNMLCQNMVDALKNVIKNVTPVIEKGLPIVSSEVLI